MTNLNRNRLLVYGTLYQKYTYMLTVTTRQLFE